MGHSAAVEAEEGSEDSITVKPDVHYNPGHIQALEAMTTDPDGEWLGSLNKLSEDRFLPVGPIMPDNDQLIHIGQGEKEMELVADHPAYPEPHDCVFAHKDTIDARRSTTRTTTRRPTLPRRTRVSSARARTRPRQDDDQALGVRPAGLHGSGGRRGETSTTNTEGVQDIIHRRRHRPENDNNSDVTRQDTREVTFTADDPGVYWIYCTYFVAPCTWRCAAGDRRTGGGVAPQPIRGVQPCNDPPSTTSVRSGGASPRSGAAVRRGARVPDVAHQRRCGAIPRTTLRVSLYAYPHLTGDCIEMARLNHYVGFYFPDPVLVEPNFPVEENAIDVPEWSLGPVAFIGDHCCQRSSPSHRPSTSSSAA